MKLISLNIRGVGECGKKRWIKSIIRNEKPDMIGIQETKRGVVDDEWVEDIWGGMGYGYTQLTATGNSGGILLIWDKGVFSCKDAIGDERFIAVRGSWQGKGGDIFLACIYGPHVTRQKASLWDRLTGLMNRWQGAWCIFGDLNVVRSVDDRLNSQVNLKEASDFNDFINNMRLVEIPMGVGHAVVKSLKRVISVKCSGIHGRLASSDGIHVCLAEILMLNRVFGRRCSLHLKDGSIPDGMVCDLCMGASVSVGCDQLFIELVCSLPFLVLLWFSILSGVVISSWYKAFADSMCFCNMEMLVAANISQEKNICLCQLVKAMCQNVYKVVQLRKGRRLLPVFLYFFANLCTHPTWQRD
ncbi:hypothetical protein CTI12_AA450330 [Artemisia annua]|uniref:Endonuclease/exonuclease/phosphatase domain-containing protein n=1 Tax=Artemisia annua TaxID=35608 RepID=A0A2U1LUB3_ARTAN|nr:hypothetical protein CTI12_AA450330 [Artemisia annua]